MEPEIRTGSLSGPEVALGATSSAISNLFSHCVLLYLGSFGYVLVWSSSWALSNLSQSQSFCLHLVLLL